MVTKTTDYTKPYISRVSRRKNVSVAQFEHDRDVVTNYDYLYQIKSFGYEVTKPSEQAFKALFTPKQVGGSILLFTNPVGRQEYDNLWFLTRHRLIPNKQDQNKLWDAAMKGENIDGRLLRKAKRWRGIRLDLSAERSAVFVEWCLSQGVFAKMMECTVSPSKHDKHKEELGWEGVRGIWAKVDELN